MNQLKLFIYPYFNFRDLYVVGLILMAASIPLSLFFSSVFQFWIIGCWLFDGILEKDIPQKLKKLATNKLAWLLISLYLLHIAGLLNTENTSYALRDLRIKLPLIVFPFFMCSFISISKRQLKFILTGFVLSVFLNSIVAIYNYNQMATLPDFNLRNIIPFVSHIRLGIMAAFAVIIAAYFSIKETAIKGKLIYAFFVVWLLFFMSFAGLVTGLVSVVGAFLYGLIYIILKIKKPITKYSSILLVLLLMASVFYYLFSILQLYTGEKKDTQIIYSLSSKGNIYSHQFEMTEKENGQLVWMYIQEEELKEEWNKRSIIPYNTSDNKGHLIYTTLIRYLTSKSLKKDAEGVKALTKEDIINIENGVTNYLFTTPSIKQRIYEYIQDFDSYLNGKDPQGSSLGQRVFYAQNGIKVLRKNIISGTGTGDVQDELNKMYDSTKIKLEKQFKLRTHNQFLTLFITFGIGGFLLFLASLFLPLFTRRNNFLYIVFFIIISLSFLTDDTLETQTGVTLFAFFNSLLLFSLK